jgi:hypothetical protein
MLFIRIAFNVEVKIEALQIGSTSAVSSEILIIFTSLILEANAPLMNRHGDDRVEWTLMATSTRYNSELTRQRTPVVSRNTAAFCLSESSGLPLISVTKPRQFWRATVPPTRKRSPASVLNILICKMVWASLGLQKT